MGNIFGKSRISQTFSVKRKTQKKHTEDTDTPQTVKDVPSKFRFVFVGETGSAKTSAILKFFGLTESANSEDIVQIWKNEDIEVVHLEGLMQTDSLEDDVSKLAAYLVFLKESFKQAIPTVVFVTARLDDNRFEGESSIFSKVLKAVSLLLLEITDKKFSNLILLLTNSDSPEVESEVALRLDRYKAAFKNVIEVENNVPCLVVSNDIAKTFLDLKSILEENTLNSFNPCKEFIEEYIDGEKMSGEFAYKGKLLGDLKTDAFYTISRKIRECIIMDVFSPINIDLINDYDDECDEDEESGKSEHRQNVALNFCSKLPGNYNQVDTYVPVFGDDYILMANCEKKLINKCKVGEKIKRFPDGVGIITGIIEADLNSKAHCEIYTVSNYESESHEHKKGESKSETVGDSMDKVEKKLKLKLVQVFIEGEVSGNRSLYWVWDLYYKRFKLRNLKQSSDQNEIEKIYFIEIDNGLNGNFILNDIVRVASNNLESDTATTRM